MAEFEDALRSLGNGVAEAQKATDALSKAVKQLQSAVKTGNVQQIEKQLAQIGTVAETARQAASTLPGTWLFDSRSFLEHGYLEELKAEADAAGLKIHVRDGRLYAFPLLIRPVPGDTALRVGKTIDRAIRPKELVRKLQRLVDRPQKFNEQRFLDLIYRVYQRLSGSEWKRVERGSGPALLLTEMYEVMTILPGSEYSLEDFGRDLLLLDRKSDLRTRDDAGFRLVSSTMGRTAKKIIIYDEDGNAREFVAIQFTRGI